MGKQQAPAEKRPVAMYTEASVRAAPKASMDRACNRRVKRIAPTLPKRCLQKISEQRGDKYIRDEWYNYRN